MEVTEIFRSFQGEGPSIGYPAVFLRLRRCNLACHWCDTRYTWDKRDSGYKQYREISMEQVRREIESLMLTGDLLVVTGGEPLIWKRELKELLVDFPKVEIETNGTISGEGFGEGVHFNVSPKLLSSQPTLHATTIRPEVLRGFSQMKRAVFKFVVWSTRDMKIIDRLVDEFSLHPVYLMPEGVTQRQILKGIRELTPECLSRGWRITPRLQILVYGNKRGT